MQFIRDYLAEHKGQGYEIIGQVDLPVLSEIKALRKEKGIDEIIVGDPSFTDDQLEKLLDYAQINNILYRYLPALIRVIKGVWRG